MDYNKFIENIAFSKNMNPFHDSFSETTLQEFLIKNIDDTFSDKEISFAIFMLLLNPLYKEFYTTLKKQFTNPSTVIDYFLYSVSMANHDLIVLHKQLIDKSSKVNKYDFIELTREHVDSGGMENSYANMLDSLIDTLDFNFSLIRFTSSVKLNDDLIRIPIGNYYQHFYKSNIFTVLKHLFDKICFEKMKCTYQNNILFLRHEIVDFDMYKAIGYYRMETNIQYATQEWLSDTNNMLLLAQNKQYSTKKIKETCIDGSTGEIKISLDNIIYNQELEICFIKNYACISYYHEHLPDKVNEYVCKYIKLFTVLQYIAINIEGVIFNKIETNRDEIVNPNYELFKFKKNILIKYIIKLSGEKVSTVNDFLKNVTNNGKESFWIKPIIETDISFIIVIQSITNANILNLVDTLLINNKKDYDFKGSDFENYVKTKIQELSNRRGFYCKILPTKKYSISPKDYEEVDLIWETKNTLILGEIKNIRYPFTARNTYEYIKTLKHASKQICRKKDFLKKNRDKFSNINFNKKVVCCIITNYPFFAGINIENIPVIDFGILYKYIEIGYTARVEFTDKSKYFDKIVFYNDEEEYSDNLIDYIKNPTPVQVFKSRLSCEELEYDMLNDFKINVLNVISK